MLLYIIISTSCFFSRECSKIIAQAPDDPKKRLIGKYSLKVGGNQLIESHNEVVHSFHLFFVPESPTCKKTLGSFGEADKNQINSCYLPRFR